jgi:hypothetical protein
MALLDDLDRGLLDLIFPAIAWSRGNRWNSGRADISRRRAPWR